MLAHNLANRTIILAINHLTKFALFGQSSTDEEIQELFMPAMSR